MRALGRLLLLVVLLVVVGGLLIWRRPLWVDMQLTHFGLFTAGVRSEYVLLPEGRVHYYDAEPRFAPEHGVPLVLVHGLGDRGEAWAPMLKRLKKAGFHVYVPDLLGYGRSPKPGDSDYSIETEEKFVADFIQAIGLQKPDVAGWSMGGWITLKLALDHPDMVDRVVIYNAAGLRQGQPDLPQNIFHPQTPDDVQQLNHMLEPHAKALPNYVAVDAMRRLQNEQNVIDKNMESMRSGKDGLDDQIGKLTEPLLIVWGADDRLVPLAVGQRFHQLVPTSELDIAEGCAHLAPRFCSQRLAAATADFLKANPVPQGQVRTLTAMGR